MPGGTVVVPTRTRHRDVVGGTFALGFDKKRIDLGVVVGDWCVERHRDSVVPGDDFQRTPEIGFLHVHLKVSLMIIGYGT